MNRSPVLGTADPDQDTCNWGWNKNFTEIISGGNQEVLDADKTCGTGAGWAARRQSEGEPDNQFGP